MHCWNIYDEQTGGACIVMYTHEPLESLENNSLATVYKYITLSYVCRMQF